MGSYQPGTRSGVHPQLLARKIERWYKLGVMVTAAGTETAADGAVCIFFEHNVGDAARAFPIVPGPGHRSHLHALDLIRGDAPQRLGQVLSRHRLVVHQHLEIGRPAQGHVAHTIHGQQGIFAQNVGGRYAGVTRVVVGVVRVTLVLRPRIGWSS